MNSYDVFDTCLVRTVARPSDVHFLVAKAVLQRLKGNADKVEIAELARLRLHAERQAKASTNQEDVTLEDIYVHLDCRPWDIDRREMMEEELRLESRLVRPVARIRTEVERLRSRGEPVVFISDTPLPTACVKQMLEDAGIACSQDRVYASGDLGLTKASGSLFEYALDHEVDGIASWTHRGDHPHSDITVAQRLGLRSSPFIESRLSRYERILEEEGEDEPWVRSRIAGVSRASRLMTSIEEGPYPALSRLAAGVIGPLLTCFVAWVLRQAQEAGVERLYFVSRDGETLLEIVEALSTRMPIPECRYLYGSRQAWLFPATTTLERGELSWLLDESRILRDLLAKLRVDPAAVEHELAAYGFERSDLTRRLDEKQLERFWEFLQHPKVASSVLKSASDERRRVMDYLEQEGLTSPGRWALVDVGWKLRSQWALRRILDIAGHGEAVTGFYLALSGRRRPMAETGAYSALFLAEENQDVQRLFKNAMVLEEAFLSASHGGVVGYASHNRRTVPIFEELEPDPLRERFLKGLREVIAVYAREAAEAGILSDHLHELRRAVLRVTAEFLTRPSPDEARTLAWIMANDDPLNDPRQRRGLVVQLNIRDVLSRFAHRNLARYGPIRRQRDFPRRFFWLEGSLAVSPAWIRSGYELASQVLLNRALKRTVESMARWRSWAVQNAIRFSRKDHT